jgi:hypothetical protein
MTPMVLILIVVFVVAPIAAAMAKRLESGARRACRKVLTPSGSHESKVRSKPSWTRCKNWRSIRSS